MNNFVVLFNGKAKVALTNALVTMDLGGGLFGMIPITASGPQPPKPPANSVFSNGGTSLIIRAQPDDMKTDPSGDRIACGAITP